MLDRSRLFMAKGRLVSSVFDLLYCAENDGESAARGDWHTTYEMRQRTEINVPDMSETSTWTASRRSVILSRMEASVICAIAYVVIEEGRRKIEEKLVRCARRCD